MRNRRRGRAPGSRARSCRMKAHALLSACYRSTRVKPGRTAENAEIADIAEEREKLNESTPLFSSLRSLCPLRLRGSIGLSSLRGRDADRGIAGCAGGCAGSDSGGQAGRRARIDDHLAWVPVSRQSSTGAGGGGGGTRGGGRARDGWAGGRGDRRRVG